MLRKGSSGPFGSAAGRAGMIVALALLMLVGASLLFFFPRQAQQASSRRELMTRFMEQDYNCCDLSVARRNPRCEEILRGIGELARGGPRSEFTVPAGNALARCPAAELMGFAGDPAALRQPIPFLAVKIQAQDPAVARRAARLLVSDSTLAREIALGVAHGAGPLCWGATPAPASPSDAAAKPQCPHAPELVDAVARLFVDEKEPEADRQKAAAMLDLLGETAAPAVPALARALESRAPAIRSLAASTLAGMGHSAAAALPALTRLAHREPAPGLRQEILAGLARIDAEAGCCYALFRQPDPLCQETLAAIVRRRTMSDCPAAQILEIAGTAQAIAHPMPHLATALRAPEIGTRREAAITVALIAGTLHWHSHIDRDVVSALQDAFRSGTPELALDAADALRQIPDSFSAEGSSAEPETFLATLQDETSDRRAAAAWALGQVGRPALGAVPALRKALDGSDEVLADSAYAALNRIAVAAGLGQLGYKTNGKYVMRPEGIAALMKLSGGQPAAVTR